MEADSKESTKRKRSSGESSSKNEKKEARKDSGSKGGSKESRGEKREKDSPSAKKEASSKKKKQTPQNGYEELIKAGTIKRIMKIDKNVKMTGSEAVYLVSKATELFLGRIMQKAVSTRTSNPQAKSIHYNDVARTVRENPEMDFLVDLLPEV